MKRAVLFVLIAAVVCIPLCGCADRDTGLDDYAAATPMVPESSPEASPLITPVPTPDIDDGIVQDQDGLIEDEDTGRNSVSGKTGTANGAMLNPSPQVTAKP